MQNSYKPLSRLSGHGVIMRTLSTFATGPSWLYHYRALQLGTASQVAPVDKFSLLFVITISMLFLGETLSWKIALGGTLITVVAAI